MSAIFSDPQWRRGTTLLSGEQIELDGSGNPVAGGEIVGQVKAFQDVNPVGRGERYSNRLVYCVAARYKGITISDASTVAGRVVDFLDEAPLSEFNGFSNSGAKYTAVIDEYLTGQLRTNDIVWLVVKGPVTVAKETGSVVATGAGVEVSADGKVVEDAGGLVIGQSIKGSPAEGAETKIRINLHSDKI